MRAHSPLHRMTTWLAIAGYALVASGLPLPFGSDAPGGNPAAAKRLAGKDRSKPFPCMDKPCGCATAEQCFSNCCCHTPAERLAWAKAHGVDHAVLTALERRVAAVAEQETGGCCSTKASSSCCSTKAADLEGSEVCSEYQSLAAASSEAATEGSPPEPKDSNRSRTVVLRAMLACGGIVAQWFAAGCSLPPPVVECPIAFPCIGCVAVVDEIDEQPDFSPAAPPPRAG